MFILIYYNIISLFISIRSFFSEHLENIEFKIIRKLAPAVFCYQYGVIRALCTEIYLTETFACIGCSKIYLFEKHFICHEMRA